MPQEAKKRYVPLHLSEAVAETAREQGLDIGGPRWRLLLMEVANWVTRL